MRKKMLLFILQAMLLMNAGFGQVPAHFTPPTPIAQQFEKYINYPVDHTTGAASIDVPLYTLKAGNTEIPISLSYHTSGVKPGDPSLPVGLGWTINPGARVTRKVMNYPDEMFPKPPSLNFDAITDRVYLENMEYAHPVYPASNRTTIYDPEYDIFTYYTGTGVTGRFIIQKQNNENIAVPLLLTRDKIKVHTANNGGQDYIDYIEIIDPNGTFYRFGQGLTLFSTAIGNSTTESTVSGFNFTGWMLTDIISADKADTVSFKWKNVKNDAGNFYKVTGINDQVIITDQMVNGPPGANELNSPEYQQATGWRSTPYYPPSQQTESYHLTNVIEGLKYKNTEVRFIYTEPGGTATQLSHLEVLSSAIKIKQVDFHKSFFTNSYLRLDSVSVRDKNDQVVNRYKFGYNLSTQLPAAPTRATDFWGYYNGATSNNSLVPNFVYTVTPGGVPGSNQPYSQAFSTSNRSPSFSAAACILNSVTYPTGGKTTYEYEMNQIYDQLNHQAIASGGLRVKKISHWLADGQLAESRAFFYGLNECGYGDGTPMQADMFVNTTKTAYYDGGVLGDIFRKRVLMGSPANSLFMYDFPPVTYQEITEYIGDKNGANSGKVVYKYTKGDYPLRHFPLSMNPHTYMDRYWNRPRLLSTTSYKNNQGIYTPARSSSTSYFQVESDTINSLAVRRFGYISANNSGITANQVEDNFWIYFPSLGSVFDIAPIYLYSGLAAPLQLRSVEYSPSGDSIVTEQTYNYANNDYLYPISLTTTNSEGTATTTHYKYPKDYDVGSSPGNPVAQGIKLLKDRNVVSPVIEEYTEVQPGNVIKSGKFTTYKTDQPVPENVYSLNAISPASSFIPATITSSSHTKSSSYLFKSKFDLYDPNGNIRQVTDQTTGISTVILYSYGGQFPIAIIKNATYSTVAAALSGGDAAINSFASGYPTNDAAVINFLSPLRSSLPQAFITTYTHDPEFGITSQTDENGRTTYYQYDAAGRLQLIKDKDGNVVKTFEYKYRQ